MNRRWFQISVLLSAFFFMVACGAKKDDVEFFDTIAEEVLYGEVEDEAVDSEQQDDLILADKTKDMEETEESCPSLGEAEERYSMSAEAIETGEAVGEMNASEEGNSQSKLQVSWNESQSQNMDEDTSESLIVRETELVLESQNSEEVHQHELYEYWWFYPDCVNRGYYFLRCKGCDYEETGNDEKKLKPLGHQPDDGTVVKNPTCMHTGVKEHHCKVCQAALEDSVVPIDENVHVWLRDELGEYCDVCNKER